jgi:hypothetical protein
MFCAEKMSTPDKAEAVIVIMQGEKTGEASLIAGSERRKGETECELF